VGIDSGPVLVLGGRSEIGVAVAERLARRGCRTVVLAARRAGELDPEAARLASAGATTVGRVEFDADDLGSHQQMSDEVTRRYRVPATVVVPPDQVADAVVDALARDREVVWVPPVLRWVFAGMRLLPRAVWRRLPR
jgi:NAD(P)-dependent dehydrogenase (short-subunit alcohol dehydrogenase family)